ncbi:MAG TPA: tetraacyldisaccharide 4'-kinase [Steroidobacter sp.]|nr:tetraacyldisaccharide 4'-kinase [Steroidobacter sp.]
MLDVFFQRLWYGRERQWLAVALAPLSWIFGLIVSLRRAAFRSGVFRSHRVARPVVVIGNISVGGVGKTPLTIWLANELTARGVQVGIVLRGYGGRSDHWPRRVTPESPVAEVGDEAVLLASRTPAIVVVGPDRAADARHVVELGAQIVVSDDGLQHYRLARDCEIAVIDEQRGVGNGRLLPAGPLREPRSRLSSVDLVILTKRAGAEESAARNFGSPAGELAVGRLTHAISLVSGEVRPLAAFRGAPVHALAAIGNPDAFFQALAREGLAVDAHPRRDHAALTPADVRFDDDAPVLMTEKDAVKCRPFADARLWAVRMELDISPSGRARLAALLDRLLPAPPSNAR